MRYMFFFPFCLYSLNHFRWIVPAKGQVRLRIRFRCDQVGQFDQIFNFELLNSRRIYQLYCRGICALPTISREPRYVCVLIFVLQAKNLNKSIIFHITRTFNVLTIN